MSGVVAGHLEQTDTFVVPQGMGTDIQVPGSGTDVPLSHGVIAHQVLEGLDADPAGGIDRKPKRVGERRCVHTSKLGP